MPLQLIPKALVTGVFTPSGIPGTPERLTPERLNRAWSELAPTLGYTQLQLSADLAAANFSGPTPDDGLVIQPPLLQFRAAIAMTVALAGESAQGTIQALVRTLGVSNLQQLGVKLVYWSPLDDNDGRGYVLRRLFRPTPDKLSYLAAEGGEVWAGAKLVAPQPSGAVFTALIEPLVRDMKNLYLEVDAQFAGPVDLDRIAARVAEVETYLTRTLVTFIDREPEA